MYAESIIADKLAACKRTLGWMPEYHSVEEVDKYNAHLRAMEEQDTKGNIWLDDAKLARQDVWWIRNERALCFCDERYFATRYAFVWDEENHLVHYRPRASQAVFHRILQDFDARQQSIEIQVLKARQQGISTEVELKFTHRILFVPGTKAIAASADGQKSELMSMMFHTVIDNIPWWLRSTITKRRSGERGMVQFATSSIVAVQSGNQDTGIGQGWTPVLAHVSEVCDYTDPVTLIDEGLFKAMHTSPVLFLVLESTGNGNTGWWANTWRTSKEFYPQGRARLFPMFLPWHMCTDMFPKKSWLEKFPVPEEWAPAKETIAHATKCAAFVRNTDYLVRELGKKWVLPRHQQWYWEFNHQEAARKNAAKSWLRQMPCDDKEALTSENDSVFGQETIEVVSEQRERDYKVYAIVGEGIDEKHEPQTSDVDYEEERIELEFSDTNGSRYEWMLVPIKRSTINEADEQTAMKRLIVFEPPIQGCEYSIGGDIGGGVGDDRSILTPCRKGPDSEQDIQAAEFCSDDIGHIDIAAFAAAIGSWYGKGVPTYGLPKFCIEQVRKYGDTCQLQLKKMGFYRHHNMIRYDNKKIEENKSHKQGFFTHTWSRPMLLGNFVDAVEGGWIKTNSPFLIKELEEFEQRYTASGMSRQEHQQGKHDDRIFGCALSYFTLRHLDVMIARHQKRYNAPKSKLPELDLSPYTFGRFPVFDKGERL